MMTIGSIARGVMMTTTMMLTIHPKWFSCFPDGTHRWDDGTDDDDPSIQHLLELKGIRQAPPDGAPAQQDMTEEDRLLAELAKLGV